jgi:hypothetical protein
LTKKILEEIHFYNRFRPFKMLNSGMFGNGQGIEGEHLININIDITYGNFNFKDNFEWDLINQNNK